MKIQKQIEKIFTPDTFLFLYLKIIAIEILLTGCAMLITGNKLSGNYLESFSSYLVFNGIVFLGAIVLFLGSFLIPDRAKKILLKYASNKKLPWLILFGIICAAALLLISGNYFSRLLPVIVCIWVIGFEFILYATIRMEPAEKSQTTISFKLWKALIFIFIILLALGLPSNLPGTFDGVPFNHKAEFLIVAALLPFLLVLDKKVFLSRWIQIPIVFLLVLKIILLLAPMQSGMNLWVYQTPEAMEQDQWNRSYETNFYPESTTIMKSSYTETYQFPIEWFNTRLVDMDGIWVGIKVNGYIQLYEGEQLIINTRDARAVNLTLTNVTSDKTVHSNSINTDTNQVVWDDSFSPGIWHASGTASYQFGHFTFQPVIESAGDFQDAFTIDRIWQDVDSASVQKSVVSYYQVIAVLFDAIALSIFGVMLILGVRNKYKSGELSYFEIYFFPTAILLFAIALHFDQQICRWIVFSLLTLIAGFEILLSEGMAEKPRNLLYRWLLLISIVVLSIFASMDFPALSNATAFPQGQDNMTYQIEARLIYVNHDYFLVTHSPRAYKLAFPYVVGFLHLLFGQSSAAQFLLNAWAFIFTTWIVAKIIKAMLKNDNYALMFAWLLQMIYLSPLFYKNYFRYGLIEPLSTLFLIFIIYKLYQRRWRPAVLVGMILSVLRMDYAGALLVSPILIDGPWIGPWRNIFASALRFIKKNWKSYVGYAFSLVILPIVMTTFYYIKVPHYVLNASDTVQTSMYSVVEGLVRLVDGGTFEELAAWIGQYPFSLLLMWAVSISGFVLAILSLLRIKSFRNQNIQWALIYFGLMAVYVFVRPTGYSPRFSTPFIPLAIIMLAMFVYSRRSSKQIANEE